jgi:DNA-binding transcriptional LysR family regulator
MSNNHLADLQTFVAVVNAGSFTAAAQRMGRSKAVVSRQVKALEERLGAQLLHRTTRSLSATDAGAAIYERAAAALADLEDAEAAVDALHRSARGRLRVSLPIALGRRIAAPALIRLATDHPDLELDLSFSDRYVDLIGEGFDLAIRIGRLADSSLIARRLGESRPMLVASPDYLGAMGSPSHPGELPHHNCLTYAQQIHGPTWRFAGDITVAVAGRLRCDSGDALRDAAIAGFGIAWLPDFYLGDALARGHLVRLLPGLEADPVGIWAVYPHRRHLSHKVRIAVDCLVAATATGCPGPSGDSG